jgi:hypothetical protein
LPDEQEAAVTEIAEPYFLVPFLRNTLDWI